MTSFDMGGELGKELAEYMSEYRKALNEEANAKNNLRYAEHAYEESRQRVLLEAYSDGTINGKNAEMRKWQEEDVLSKNTDVFNALVAKREAEHKNDLCSARSRALYMEGLLLRVLHAPQPD